jgi:4-hydroxybenzoyl-CoA thioesterase
MPANQRIYDVLLGNRLDPDTAKLTFDIALTAALDRGSGQMMHLPDERLQMANFVSRRHFTIEWGHCDPAGIVFNSRYFEFFDSGTWSLFEAALGVRPPDLAGAFGIVGLPLVDSGARFLAPARFGDVVELTSQVSAFRRTSFDVTHQLFVHSVLAVEGRETRVWAGRDLAGPSGMKGQIIPPEIRQRFQVS